MDQQIFSKLITRLMQRPVSKFAASLALLIFPAISYAGYQTFDASGSVTLSDIKKGQRVTLQVSYLAPSDSDDISGTNGDVEQVVKGAQVTVSGTTKSITVNAQTTTQSLNFTATQDAPTVTVAIQYMGSGPIGNDGDDGSALVVWHGVDKDSGYPPCDSQCGDPINALTGNSFQKEVDYAGGGDFPLMFTRFYNSINKDRTSAFGNAWSHSYNQYFDTSGNLYRAEGPKYGPSPYGLDPDAPVTQVWFTACTGSSYLNNCYLNKATNILESYQAATGRLVALYDLKGNSQTLAYDGAGNLVSVTHSNGRSLQFTYDPMNRIATMTDPSGAVYSYTYDANNNLTSVKHPDTGTRQYVYGNASFPHAMTSLIDELANTYATWTYDANGFAISSSVGGGLIVESASSPDPSSNTHTITNGAGTTRTLVAANVNGKQLTGTATYAGSASGAIATHASVYDIAGNVTARTNNNGSMDCFSYNSLHQETFALYNGVAYGGNCSTTQNSFYRASKWHPSLYVKAAVAEPLRLTYTIYHQQPDPSNGNAVANCITPTDAAFAPYLNIICKTAVFASTDSNGSGGVTTNAIKAGVPANTHTFTYDPYGRMLTATDSLGKVTTYSYYQDATADHSIGDLQSVTNAIGQVVTFNRYDKNGRVLQTTDANGLVSTFTYDYRGNVLSQTAGALTTNYVYNVAGQLTSIQAPDGAKTTSLYDLAHRISKTSDNAGNSVNYAYDSVGNVATVTLKDNLGNTAKTSQYVYDYMNNIVKSIGSSK